MPIYDHTVGSTFSRQVVTLAPDIDEIHIDPMIDDGGFAICGEHLRVDVFPPDTDPDMPGAFISICENNLSAEQARLVATLLLAAADYVEYLDQKQGGGKPATRLSSPKSGESPRPTRRRLPL